jgi:xanthine dehydrogenase iron-sulfur cluster and FAD-binding subunit A
MVRRNGSVLDERTVRRELEGNLCRCTGYHNIVRAVMAGAAAMQDRDRAQSGETGPTRSIDSRGRALTATGQGDLQGG